MKKINILAIDSTIPNLAIEKIKIFYQRKGYSIFKEFKYLGKMPTFVSGIFSWNYLRMKFLSNYSDVELGGSGWSLSKKLPKEIEQIKPKINLGFASRGCIRKCKFCIVHKKEGSIKATGDIYDLWDKKSRKITLLDNNILALPDHFKLICNQLRKEKLSVDFNQGLDIRLVTDESAYLLSKLRFPNHIRFSIDSSKILRVAKVKLKLLKKYIKNNRFFFYILVGFDTSWEEDMERLEYVRSENCQAYVQRYESLKGNKKYTKLAQWANSFIYFKKYSFNEYLKLRDSLLKRKQYKYNLTIIERRKIFKKFKLRGDL